MPNQCNALKYSLRLVVWMVITASWLISGACEAEAGRTIRQITPMLEMTHHQVNVRPSDYFDVVGTLNLIEGDRMIIGDRELKIASGAKISRSSQWNLVGAKLDKSGAVVVVETISDEPN